MQNIHNELKKINSEVKAINSRLKQNLNDASSNLLSDPLSAVTRSARRGVLLFASVGLIICFTGVSSGDVGVAGIKLSNVSEVAIFMGLFIVLLYSLIVFRIHAFSDIKRLKYNKDKFEHMLSIESYNEAHEPPACDADEEYRASMEDEFNSMTGYRPYNVKEEPVMKLISNKIWLDVKFPFIFGSCVLLTVLIFLLGKL